jgi:hydroxyacylglutathione hydrolase
VIVRSFTVGPVYENAYLVVDRATLAAVFIDPGDEPDVLLAALKESGAGLQAIWLTHAHVDHIGGIAGIRKVHPAVPIYLHPDDRPLYAMGVQQAMMIGIPFKPPPPADRVLREEEPLTLGRLTFHVLHCPGHAPGLCAIIGHGVAFVGDLLFSGGIGRTDLPLSNPQQMEVSLLRIGSLPPETIVYPGHGPATTIGDELEDNPFLIGVAKVPGARR